MYVFFCFAVDEHVIAGMQSCSPFGLPSNVPLGFYFSKGQMCYVKFFSLHSASGGHPLDKLALVNRLEQLYYAVFRNSVATFWSSWFSRLPAFFLLFVLMPTSFVFLFCLLLCSQNFTFPHCAKALGSSSSSAGSHDFDVSTRRSLQYHDVPANWTYPVYIDIKKLFFWHSTRICSWTFPPFFLSLLKFGKNCRGTSWMHLVKKFCYFCSSSLTICLC